MRTTREEPGRLVELSAPPAAPANVFVLIVLALLLLFAALPIHLVGALLRGGGGTQRTFLIGFLAAWYGLLALMARRLVRRGRSGLRRLHVDREGFRLERPGLFGLGNRTIALSHGELRWAVVRAMPLSIGGGPPAAVLLSLALDTGHPIANPEPVAFAVDGVDTLEKAVELAVHFAAAAGYPAFHVEGPLEDGGLCITLSTRAEPGFQPVVPRDGSSPPAWHAPTVLAPSEAPFDAASFRGPYRLTEWNPGRRVRLHRPFQLSVLTFAILFYSVLIWMARMTFSTVKGPEILFFGLIVTFIGGVGLFVIGNLLFPRSTIVDWGERAIRFEFVSGKRRVPFDGLRAIELRLVRMTTRTDGNSLRSTSRSYTYYGSVQAVFRREGTERLASEEMADSKRFRDGESARRMAEPLARALARALDVPYRYVEE